jgi:cytidine deaminase
MDQSGSAELLARAREAAKQSYSPYSKFPVGAALSCADGTIVTGTNVENRSYGLTTCAERSAISTAISMGKRVFQALAVVCPRSDQPVSPCGACRQVLSEFCPPEMPVVYAGRDGQPVSTTIGELIPRDSLQMLKNGMPGGAPAEGSA